MNGNALRAHKANSGSIVAGLNLAAISTRNRRASSGPLSACALIVLILAITLDTGCKEKQSPAATTTPKQKSEIEVRTQRIELQQATRQLSVVGTLHAADDVTISTEVAGVLQLCAMDLGDTAAPGELLAKIVPNDYQLALNQADAALNEVVARLGGQHESLDALDPESLPAVQRAKAELEFAQFDFDRLAKLQVSVEDSSVSERELNDARMKLRVADAEIRSAREEAQATLALALQRRTAVELAKWKLDRTTVRVPGISNTTFDLMSKFVKRSPENNVGEPTESKVFANQNLDAKAIPIDWRVAERLVTEGQYVSVGDPLYRLVIVDPLKLLAKVPERYMGQVNISQTVEIDGSLVGEKLHGKIIRVSPIVNPLTRTFDIEVVVNNEHVVLKAGSFGKASIVSNAPQPLLLVPQTAISEFAGVAKAFVVEDGKAVQRELQLGERFDGQVEVRSGLKAGEELVLTPPRDLVSGQVIRVKLADASTKTEVQPPK